MNDVADKVRHDRDRHYSCKFDPRGNLLTIFMTFSEIIVSAKPYHQCACSNITCQSPANRGLWPGGR